MKRCDVNAAMNRLKSTESFAEFCAVCIEKERTRTVVAMNVECFAEFKEQERSLQ